MQFNVATQKDLEKLDWIAEEVKSLKLASTKTLIYVPTRKGCTEVMLYFKRVLKTAFYTVKGTPIIGVYNAATTEATKLFYNTEFEKTDGTVRVLISTTAFGMGIDIGSISRVVHWGGSNNCFAYWQEVGRAGRGGQPVTYHLYFIPALLSKSVDEIYKYILYETAAMKRPPRSTAHSKTTQTTEEESDSGESDSSIDSSNDSSSNPSVDAAKGAVTQHPQPSLKVSTKCFRRAIL